MNWSSRNTRLALLIGAVVLVTFGYVMGTFQYDYLGFAEEATPLPSSSTNASEDPPAKPDEALRTAESIERALKYAAERVRPAVVTIYTQKQVEVPGFPFGRQFGPRSDFFRRFFDQEQSRTRPVTGLGSGMIIRSDGYILTNHHVVEQADEIKVMLQDQESADAKIVASDKHSDLAVIRVEKDGLPSVRFADSDELSVGQWALAIGSPFQLQNSVSVGHISAMHRAINFRRYEDLIQTDAAINRGNSGGPLVNIRGQVIGVNTLIVSEGAQGNQGVGFAITSNLARRVAEDLIEFGRVKRPWLGVVIQELTPEMAQHFEADRGVLVSEVKQGSPADEAGLESGNLITHFDGERVSTPHELQMAVLEHSVGEEVSLKVVTREGTTKTVTATLALLPENGPQENGESESSEPSESDLHLQLGMKLKTLSAEEARQRGIAPAQPVLEVQAVRRGSPAERANLQSGDLILAVARQNVKSVEAFDKLLARLKSRGESKVLLHVKRESSFFTLLPLGD